MQRNTLLDAIVGISDGLFYRRKHGVITLHGDSSLLLLKKVDKAEKLEAIIDVNISESEFKQILDKVGKRLHLRKDWLDETIQMKLSNNGRRIYHTEITALTVYYTDIEYILAMKMIYGEGKDIKIINRLIKEINIHNVAELLHYVGKYYDVRKVNNNLLQKVEYS